MKIRMKLLSDVIFGNGASVPGGEDLSVLHDKDGFPYYKGGTLKGIFREELENIRIWSGDTEEEAGQLANRLLGNHGDDRDDVRKLRFSDMTVPPAVRAAVLDEIGEDPDAVLAAFTGTRTFTAVEDDGVVKTGSLRMARYVCSGIELEGEIDCRPEEEELVKEVLSCVKWVGSMRSRGFGKVRIAVKGEDGNE